MCFSSRALHLLESVILSRDSGGGGDLSRLCVTGDSEPAICCPWKAYCRCGNVSPRQKQRRAGELMRLLMLTKGPKCNLSNTEGGKMRFKAFLLLNADGCSIIPRPVFVCTVTWLEVRFRFCQNHRQTDNCIRAPLLILFAKNRPSGVL